jgi:hypothetical protein
LASTNASDRFWIEQCFALLCATLSYRKLAASHLVAAGDGVDSATFAHHSTLACKALNKAAGLCVYVRDVVLPVSAVAAMRRA